MNDSGRWGEEMAAAHLRSAGCRILARNWRAGRYEVDLVVRDGSTIAFVEVKTRSPGPQDPLEAIDWRKRRNLRIAAARWIASSAERAGEYRFDAVAVRRSIGRSPEVEHIRGAFSADDV